MNILPVLERIQGYAVALLDAEGRFLYTNDILERLVGFSSEELQGEPLTRIFVMANALPLPEKLAKVTESASHLLSREVVCKSGDRCFINGSLNVLRSEADELTGFLLIFHDFSNPHRDHEALQTSLKELADIKYALDESAILAITDPSGKITYINDTFCKISKYAREDLLGQDHRIINSGHHPKSFFQELWSTIKAGRVWQGEIKNRAKDGSFYWVDTTIVPFMDASGQPYQFVSIRNDITRMKRIEEELRLLNEELEDRVQQRTEALEQTNEELSETLGQLQESERLREAFIAAVTHDLRTPLVAQKRALELLVSRKDHLPADKLETLMERLLKSNDDLLLMVNKLLEIYQYEAGKVHLYKEPTDLGDLLKACIDEVSPLAERKGMQLKFSPSESTLSVPVDAHQMKRVFTNLLGNAIENCPAESLIQASLRDAGEWVEASVCDNGPGISPELLPQLFDRYFLVQQKRKKIGSGLGLSICKMIVDLHGGKIHADSVLGEGSCFRVALPKASG